MSPYLSSPDGQLIGDGRGLWRRLRRGVSGAASVVLRWQELARDRRRLQEMDERMLKDIGISRADALHEASRPFWDGPARSWP